MDSVIHRVKKCLVLKFKPFIKALNVELDPYYLSLAAKSDNIEDKLFWSIQSFGYYYQPIIERCYIGDSFRQIINQMNLEKAMRISGIDKKITQVMRFHYYLEGNNGQMYDDAGGYECRCLRAFLEASNE